MDTLPGNTCDSDSNMDTRRANSPEHLAENRETDDSSPPVVDPTGDIKENHQQSATPVTPETTCCENIKPFRCCINTERLNLLRRKVEDAIKEKKTFTIKGGFQFIRNALLQRGWIEKIEIKTHVNKSCPANPPSIDEVCCNLPPKQDWESAAAHLAKCEKMILSRLLQTHDVDFYWNMRKDSNEWQQRLNKNKIINRFSRSLFTSKEGLCLLLQQLYWHTEPGVAYVRFPRCYTINFGDQCSAFVDDFRLTACIGLLKWFTETIKEYGEHSMCTADGKVPITAIQFAIDRCTEFIAIQKHLDLDKEFHKVWDHEWDQFLTNFQLIVHDGEKFDDNNCYSLFTFENSVKNTLKNIAPYWPQIELDGIRNIWIMKPGNKCRGRDIILVKDVNDVVRVMNHKLKYVVQKYIERPLLIYKAKFDIRQWFIVTCVQPLTIWMYRDCYLRFSSQIFSLDDFHESVHLTNHAVQHKYTNQERDKSLPDDNMWDNHTFKAYLRQIGQAEKWYKVIYPGMRECIIGAMLASQDTMDRRPNTFELYGADFMIAENFTPWLIEINSCPAMGPTTSVTARMCPQCFEDMVKVIIDRRRDPKADTGLFEMIYKQVLPQTPPYLGMTLSIRGRKVFKKKTSGKQKLEKKDSVENKQRTKTIKPQMQMELIKNYNGPVIGNLIEELQETLFKNSVEEETDDPSSPIMEGISRSAPIQKPIVAVQDLQPVTQKATVSLSCKQRSNKNLFLDRKLNVVRENNTSTSSRKAHSYSYNHRPSKIHANSKNTTSHQNSSLYDKWKQGVENKQIKSVSNNRWEQDTASILKSKSDVLRNTVIHSEDIKFSYLSSLTRILPDIDAKNHTSQNLFTVGLGYKNNYFKPIIKENIILPMGASQVASVVENCCLKL